MDDTLFMSITLHGFTYEDVLNQAIKRLAELDKMGYHQPPEIRFEKQFRHTRATFTCRRKQ